jgi:hypothetical protein
MVQKPQVSPTWRTTLRKAWSVRLNLLATLFLAMELIVPFLTNKVPPYMFVILALVSVIGSTWARVLIQKNMQELVNGKP